MRSKFPNRLYDGKFFLAYGQDQHQGRRPYQEDFFGFYEPEDLAGIRREGLLFVLADGMGGTNKGDTASIMAVEGMIRNYRDSLLGSVPEALNAAVNRTNDEIFQRGLADRRYWKMGTTCVAVLVKEGELYFVSVGDSHLYLLRGGRLTLLNEDHSVGVEMDRRAKAGLMTEEEALAHPGRDKLVSSLGEKAISKVDVSRSPLKLAPGDKLIVCSDGLYGYSDTSRIPDLIAKLPPQKAVERLIHETLAQEHENQDNISVQVIEVIGEARKSDVQTFIREKTHSRKTKDRKGNKKTLAIAGIAGGAILFFALGVLTGRFLLSPRSENISVQQIDAVFRFLELGVGDKVAQLKNNAQWEQAWSAADQQRANYQGELDQLLGAMPGPLRESELDEIHEKIVKARTDIDNADKTIQGIQQSIFSAIQECLTIIDWKDPVNKLKLQNIWGVLSEHQAFQAVLDSQVERALAENAQVSTRVK